MISDGEIQQMIREAEEQGYSTILPALNELQALRKAFSEPAAYEVKGVLCHTRIEAEIYFGEPEPLYRKPEVITLPI